jgi:Cu-Zn family superoxide dismutase
MQIEISYPKSAVCVLKSETVNGIIYITDYENITNIEGKITGLTPNKKHGFHIHEYGDLTDGCTSACAHFNPYNKNHGGRNTTERHVGDLGNLEADIFGNCEFKFNDSLVKLSGKANVLGRSFVIHEDEDDLGFGGKKDSLTTGHAGKRLVCGVIGWKKTC